MGSSIIAEVLVSLVHGDHQSYLWQRGPGWRPTLTETSDFTTADLLQMFDELNPIGDG